MQRLLSAKCVDKYQKKRIVSYRYSVGSDKEVYFCENDLPLAYVSRACYEFAVEVAILANHADWRVCQLSAGITPAIGGRWRFYG